MSDWTWSPFQSPQIKDICAHLAPSEHAALVRRAMLYGFWAALTLGFPAGFGGVRWSHAGSAAQIACVSLILLHGACIPLWLRAQKRFLCSTEWARIHDYQPERLSLFFG
jgi:hypothetical protein